MGGRTGRLPGQDVFHLSIISSGKAGRSVYIIKIIPLFHWDPG